MIVITYHKTKVSKKGEVLKRDVWVLLKHCGSVAETLL